MMITGGSSTIGAYLHRSPAGAGRRPARPQGRGHGDRGPQIQRLANPLINETIIGTEDKDEWNTREPEQEQRFRDYYLNPRLALSLQLVFGVPAATTDREDRQPAAQVPAEQHAVVQAPAAEPGRGADPLAAQRRMTVLADTPDLAGWPNGRRPKDDVTDIAVRVVGGPNYVGRALRRRQHGRPGPLAELPVPRDARRRAQPTARQPVARCVSDSQSQGWWRLWPPPSRLPAARSATLRRARRQARRRRHRGGRRGARAAQRKGRACLPRARARVPAAHA